MLKPLLFILVIVMLIAIALNVDLPSNVTNSSKSIDKLVVPVEIKVIPKKILLVTQKTNPIIREDHLSKELQKLLNQAEKLFQEKKDNEALLFYDIVIEKSKGSKEIKILKLFAEACFQKATIHYIYPNYDSESAIESYELIINNFQEKHNKELLVTYMKAKLQQVQFISKDETLVMYDELIEKFQKDKEKRFEKEIEELLFTKSFALMGIDDEEAIEVLDNIIAKYNDKDRLPDTVKFSILNNIELSIITSNDTVKYVDLANKYMSDSPDTKPLLDMLRIIKNAQELDQGEALEKWDEEHSNYTFPDWDFSELRKWVNKMETPESQERIRQYLDLFEKQKYKNIYQPPAASVPINNTYSDEATQNSYLDSKSIANNGQSEEIIYEEIQDYEPDPYLNDIIGTQPETSYPNPYSTYEPNSQTDGASHTYEANY